MSLDGVRLNIYWSFGRVAVMSRPVMSTNQASSAGEGCKSATRTVWFRQRREIVRVK